jgi:hypothetical protein
MKRESKKPSGWTAFLIGTPVDNGLGYKSLEKAATYTFPFIEAIILMILLIRTFSRTAII